MSRIFAAKTDLDGITHEQTFICRQLLICRSRGGLPANENWGKNPSNDNGCCSLLVMGSRGGFLCFLSAMNTLVFYFCRELSIT